MRSYTAESTQYQPGGFVATCLTLIGLTKIHLLCKRFNVSHSHKSFVNLGVFCSASGCINPARGSQIYKLALTVAHTVIFRESQ